MGSKDMAELLKTQWKLFKFHTNIPEENNRYIGVPVLCLDNFIFFKAKINNTIARPNFKIKSPSGKPCIFNTKPAAIARIPITLKKMDTIEILKVKQSACKIAGTNLIHPPKLFAYTFVNLRIFSC